MRSARLLQALTSVAPEIDPESLGVDVPERDYVKLATLNSAVDYLADRLNPGLQGPFPTVSSRPTMAIIVLSKESGMSEMLSMPSVTRKRANSG